MHENLGIAVVVNLAIAPQSAKKLVDVSGFEPPTPCLQS